MKTTKTQFWKTFGEISNTFRFTEDKECIRQKRTGRCPVCAVATRLARSVAKNVRPDDFREAAALIGLDSEFAADIALASDCTELSPKRSPAKYRRKLLKLAGLKEK